MEKGPNARCGKHGVERSPLVKAAAGLLAVVGNAIRRFESFPLRHYLDGFATVRVPETAAVSTSRAGRGCSLHMWADVANQLTNCMEPVKRSLEAI